MDVTDGNLTTTPASIALDGLTAGTIVNVGYFKAANQAALSSDFSVTTDWGDGDVDNNGFVVPTDDGGFDVYATKSTDYAGSSQPIQVTITEDSGQSGSATATFSDNSLTVDSGSTVTVSGLFASAVVTDNGVLTFNGADTENFAGAISGTGSVVINGNVALAAGNTYTGGTIVQNAMLQISDPTALGSGSLTLDGGTLQATAPLVLTASITLGQGGGTIDGNGNVVDVEAPVQGPGNLNVVDTSGAGSGVLAIDNNNTFSGSAAVSSGFLVVTSSNSLPYGSGLTVGADGTVVFGTLDSLASPAAPSQGPASASNPPTTTAATQSPTSPPGTTWLQKTGAANDATVLALAGVLDPSNETHSIGVMRQASALYVEVVFSALMPASGVSTASTSDLVDEALMQIFESANMTVTPNASPGGDIYSNPINNRMIAIDNAILQFLECNDVTSNGT